MTKMIDRELHQKWVAALRSGNYKQGFCRLYDPDDGGYCCLGVLSKLAGFEFTERGMAIVGYKDYEPIYNLFNNNSDSSAEKLVHLNDGKKLPFSEIADYIEANL